MIKFGESSCRAKILAEREDREISADIFIGQNEKGVKLNGEKIKKTAELLENILIVVFSPEDLKIVKGDPEKRRRFMDRELSQIRPSYYSDITSYRRLLLQRNALLKEAGASRQDFDVWDAGLSEYGARVNDKRKEFIEKISRISGGIHKNITNGKEYLEIIYEPSVFMKENLKRDIFKGNTETGPHRDDFLMLVNGNDIRKFGSQGQQRTAALSLKLAELSLIKEETGEEAVLLLDDVLSELDGTRQNFLISSLKDVQLFITTTEINEKLRKKLPDGYTFKIKEGKGERNGK
jgi:DNA replication and repair protein RecF